MDLTLHVWRQESPEAHGRLVRYEATDVSPDMSFLEMLDVVNEELIEKGERPIEFGHDCREGICGSCGMMINGEAHGPSKRTTTCQLHMRSFQDGDTITIEPWRADAFPVLQDLVVDRCVVRPDHRRPAATSRSTPARRRTPTRSRCRRTHADAAFDAATCIGCGACVAQCPNGAAQLFTSAKVAHLGLLPQGQPER